MKRATGKEVVHEEVVYAHACTHTHAHVHVPVHPHAQAFAHAHAHTHTQLMAVLGLNVMCQNTIENQHRQLMAVLGLNAMFQNTEENQTRSGSFFDLHEFSEHALQRKKDNRDFNQFFIHFV